ncbi:MAG TPA: LacI family DNA-binding transcriptional regulator, partial [Ktedonobacteraceae bacterium]|nr:LacI family DNA-binding transcriptional regulator [Ktedonobacteraceae bacterium]
MKPTIRDIARLAGVSKSTVSRVLNNSTNVDPATRESVQRVMAEQGFVPDGMAMQLARGEKQFIGMLLPTLTWPFIADILQGVASVVEASEREIILYTTTPFKDFSNVVDRVMATNLISGMLASFHTQSPQHLVALQKRGLPLVIINMPAARLSVPWISVANREGGMMATRHLLKLGHRRIAFLFPTTDLPCFHDRYEGYCLALREAGLEADPALLLYDDGSIYKSLQTIQSMSEKPTAIFTGNDYLAYSILAMVEKFGWHVPDDLAVVGFDDTIPPFPAQPALTTVRQPFYQI